MISLFPHILSQVLLGAEIQEDESETGA